MNNSETCHDDDLSSVWLDTNYICTHYAADKVMQETVHCFHW